MQLELDFRPSVAITRGPASIHIFPLASNKRAVATSADWVECRCGGNPKYRLAVSAQRAATHLHKLRLSMSTIAQEELRFSFAVIDELKRRGTIPDSLADGDFA